MGFRESGFALASRYSAPILAYRYRLDALIGSGGAADVHRGFDLRLRRPVAVKLFRPNTGFDTEEAFLSEAMILARLQHPGLVTAYDAGRHDGDAYLVMQLIEGRTLKARIAEGPLSPEATAALGRRPRRRPGPRARRGDRPPRRQTVQRHPRRIRSPPPHRLRHIPVARCHHTHRHRHRHPHGHGGLSVARTGPGTARRTACRRLRPGPGASRMPHRQARVRRRPLGGRNSATSPCGPASRASSPRNSPPC